ncbi:MBF transcription factor complex subunit Res2 [Schizosaccharomyces octosporus yFS286]|uniref:MBF transcription factor complex subunit Res2 n=1 Tax=Schizosaccharomyces octosporus (strain yFS286) TaxID=483514 RepID=S9R880_SCHOY|nr:MBF transcription factor complex subunit Res2 [Schizosaccharomyces octosporus yFS286]EPX74430.1 MBF transcription factor complex subunit Res2 [Schizosaccharomyces octosporus yFS286]
MAPRSTAVHIAVYSGVEVYECFIKGVSVMRRRRDSWLNATQILKVADFDKPQRTRVLEKEVQIGTHEKVQGGYGKYQGTWVPYERGVDLATHYNVLEILGPVLNFEITDDDPPAQKKRVTKPKRPSVRGRRGRKPSSLSNATNHQVQDNFESSPASPMIASTTNNLSSAAEEPSSVTPLPPSPSTTLLSPDEVIQKEEESSMLDSSLDKYEESLLDFFLHPEEARIPSFLYSPPPDFQVNSVIDDDGHTSLHWACSMGHIEMIKLLLRANADIGVCNRLSQTPLMRSVIFTNNYDCQTFQQVLDLLQSTIYAVDSCGQSILHHVVRSTSTPSKVNAAKYYLDSVLEKLVLIQPFENVVRLVNLQDSSGDTALLIAARNGATECVNSLLSYNANPSIPNRQRRTASEYLAETDKKSQAIVPASNGNSLRNLPFSYFAPTIIAPSCSSHAFGKAIPSISEKFSELAEQYEASLREKEDALARANRLKQDTHGEIARTYQELILLQKNDPDHLDTLERLNLAEQDRCHNMFLELQAWIERRQEFDLNESIKETRLSAGNWEIEPQAEDKASWDNVKQKYGDVDERTALLNRLNLLQTSRKQMTFYISKQYEEMGIDDTVNNYRRLIAMSCGINPEELSLEILDAVEEALARDK